MKKDPWEELSWKTAREREWKESGKGGWGQSRVEGGGAEEQSEEKGREGSSG